MPVTRCTSSVLFLVAKYHIPPKKEKKKKKVDLGPEVGKVKISPDYLLVPESKEILKMVGTHQKATELSWKGS